MRTRPRGPESTQRRQHVQTAVAAFDEVFEDLGFRMGLKCQDN